MKAQLQLDAKGWVMLLILSVFWGGSFLFVEIGLEELQPLTIVAARIGIAAIISILFLMAMSEKMPRGFPIWRSFLMMGLINNVAPFILITWGQQYVLGGVAAILNASTPIFTVLLAQVFTNDEKLSISKITGLAIAMVGVVTVIGLDAVSEFSAANLGQVAILLAGVSYAAASIYGRRYGRAGVSPLSVTVGQLVVGAVMLVPIALYMEPGVLEHGVSLRVGGAMVGLAVISTALAYLLYFKLIATAGATNATLVTVLVPGSAAILTWLVLGEQLPGEAFGGMAIITAGLLILDGRSIAWIANKVFRRQQTG